MFKNNQSYAEIGRTLGVSRQRIHQIVNNYKNTGRADRIKRYRELGEICALCQKNKTVNLHHKDFDNTNDSINNLIPICKECHYQLHKDRPYIRRSSIHVYDWFFPYIRCSGCISIKRKHFKNGYCRKCYKNKKE